jgi:hypothetical protein
MPPSILNRQNSLLLTCNVAFKSFAGAPSQPPAGLRVSEATEYLEAVPPRKGLTEKEMEAINMGGVDL